MAATEAMTNDLLDNVTLKLDGEVNLAEYARALAGMTELLGALTQHRAGSAALDWTVDGLAFSSAVTTARGRPRKAVAGRLIHLTQVVRDWGDVGDRLRTDRPLEGFPPRVQKAAHGLRDLLSRKGTAIEKMWFENGEREVAVQRDPDPASDPDAHLLVSYGSVRGYVEAISRRGGLRFTLYDRIFEKAVSCYLSEGMQETMRALWGRYVLVEGTVRRERATGRVVSVRDVVHAAPLPEGAPDAWRVAVGCAPSVRGSPSSEGAVREVRDRDDE